MEDERLRWQCRRGMLELDLMLQSFLARGYGDLDEIGRRAFALLLDYPDPVLLDTLMGRMVPADPVVAHVVRQIRGAAHA